MGLLLRNENNDSTSQYVKLENTSNSRFAWITMFINLLGYCVKPIKI